MEKMDHRTLDDMEEMATSHADLKEYDKAEQLYREILNRRLEQEGIPATYRDMYNLAAVLVSNQKYEEALPLLRDLFVYLSQRTIGRDRPEFMDQEAATARLLAQSCEGRRQLVMAKELKATEEGVDFSDSSEDEKDAAVEQQLLEPAEPATEVLDEKSKKRKTSH